jgi:hypothetical protein
MEIHPSQHYSVIWLPYDTRLPSILYLLFQIYLWDYLTIPFYLLLLFTLIFPPFFRHFVDITILFTVTYLLATFTDAFSLRCYHDIDPWAILCYHLLVQQPTTFLFPYRLPQYLLLFYKWIPLFTVCCPSSLLGPSSHSRSLRSLLPPPSCSIKHGAVFLIFILYLPYLRYLFSTLLTTFQWYPF